MIDYRTPTAEILFALNHAAQGAELADWEGDDIAEVVRHAARFIDGVVAPLDSIADREGARLVDGRVRMPAAFREAYSRYRDGGWCALAAEPQYGGQGMPALFSAAFAEMLSGACISFHMSVSLAQSAMRTLSANAGPEIKNLWIPRLAAGDWMAAMGLTEPQAGSDLSLIRTTARYNAGTWRLDGAKIFISGGDQDLTARVLHLVLARTPNAPPGLQGLSLFMVPSQLENGQANGIAVVRIEEKMGLHGSPTCQLAFDGAGGELIGNQGEGLQRMFTLMNLQRLDVALQGVGLAECASQRTRAYAGTRRQGKAAGRPAPVLINEHPDVRRMLMRQMALAMGGRAMCYRVLADIETGRSTGVFADMMTSTCKYFCTEAAFDAAQIAIQSHGGYGYLHEYRVEQILRDACVTRIYEGTNGIHAATLANRVIRNDAVLTRFRADIETVIAELSSLREDHYANALTAICEDWQRATNAMLSFAASASLADAYMRLTGMAAFGVAWGRLLAVADAAPDPAKVRALARYVGDVMFAEAGGHAKVCLSGANFGDLPAELFDV